MKNPVIVRLVWLTGLLSLIGLGWVCSNLTTPHIPTAAISSLVVVGLYAATTGIDVREARKDSRLIISAVTVGVVLKAALVTGPVWALTRNVALSVAVGVIFSQIDPLSVAAMSSSSRMSNQAKHIISAWASFDDPVSVLLARYAVPLIIGAGGLAIGSDIELADWAVQLLLNLAVGGIVYATWRATRTWHKLASYVLLAVTMVTAIAFQLVLAIAMVGLFLRPLAQKVVDAAVMVAYAVAAIFMGTLLTNGISPYYGALVGCAAYAVHAMVSWLLTMARGLDAADRVRLALGQQSGITACNLTLLFGATIPQIAAICAPALVVVNTLHLLSNAGFDWMETRKATS